MPGGERRRRQATLADFDPRYATEGSEERRRRALRPRPLPLPEVIVGEPEVLPQVDPDIVIGEPVMEPAPGTIQLPEVRLGAPSAVQQLPEVRLGAPKPTPEAVDQAADAAAARQRERRPDLEESRDFAYELGRQYDQWRGGALPSTPDMSTPEGVPTLEDIYRAGLVERPGGPPTAPPTAQVPALAEPVAPGALSPLAERLDANRAAVRGVQSEMSQYQPTGAIPTGDGSVPDQPTPQPVAPGRPRAGARRPVTARGEGLPPEAQAEVLDAARGALGGSLDVERKPPVDREMELIGAGEDIARQRAEVVAQGARDRVTALDAAQRQREDLNRRRQDALGTARMAFERANREAASMRIDPQHWWSDRGFAGGVAASIAMAMGSFAEAMGAGPNRAAEMIQSAIQRDVESQRLNAAIARQGADGARSAYYMTRNQFQDADAAQAAAEALMLQRVQADVDRRAAEIGTQEAKVNGEALRLELETARQQAQARAEAAEAERRLEAAETMSEIDLNMARAERERRRGRGGGGGGAGPGAGGSVLGRPMSIQQQQAADEAVRRLEAAGHSHEEAVAAVAQQYGVHPSMIEGGGATYMSPTQRRTVAAFVSTLDEVERGIGRASSGSVLGEGDIRGVGPLGPAQRAYDYVTGGGSAAELNQAVEMLNQAYAQMVSGSSYTDAQLERLMEAVRGAGSDADLRHAISMLRNHMEAITRGDVRGSGGGQPQAQEEPEDPYAEFGGRRD